MIPTATPAPPTVTPTATPLPTPDPAWLRDAAALAIDKGMARVHEAVGEAMLVCARYEDTDADGTPEWLVLTHQQGAPSRLSAFVLDGDAYYTLAASQPSPGDPDVGLGEYATCELEVRAINADGRPEIAIFGHTGSNKTLLHLYVWDGREDTGTTEGYRRLGDFIGTAGVFFEETDGDLAEEIAVGYREQGAPDLARYIIHTWDGLTYGWTADRYDWYTLQRPHAYPTHKPVYAVMSFYLALDERDLPGAFALLTAEAQAAQTYETWALGFLTTVQVQVGDVHLVPAASGETQARVTAMVTAWDNVGGRIVVRLWNVEWDTVLTAAGWRLVSGTTTQLDEWDAPYWK